MNDYGFIITRHVNSETTNKYWNTCVRCLRKLYPYKQIVIIDDNSNYNLVKSDYDYKNLLIIQSEFKGRGELLPYYYFLKRKFFSNAVIIHDSVFFHKRYSFEKLNGLNAVPLWYFNADTENIDNTLRIARYLKNSHEIQNKLLLHNELVLMPTTKWNGCFGGQSYINHSFLVHLENKYRFTNLISSIKCRADRCSFERIIGCLIFTECNQTKQIKSLFGCIFNYQKWGYTYNQYEEDMKKRKLPKSVVKIWTGR